MRRTLHEILGTAKSLAAIPVSDLVENVSLHATERGAPHGDVRMVMPYDWASSLTAVEPSMQILLVSVSRDEWDEQAQPEEQAQKGREG